MALRPQNHNATTPIIMKQIAIDMDEVIARPNDRFIEWYARDTGVKISEEILFQEGKKFYQYFGEEKGGPIREYLFHKGFFKDLPLMADCQEVIRWLDQHYEIFFVTAAMEFRNSMEDKYDWLQQYFPFISWRQYVFCGRKDMISTDYLIDDHVSNLISFRGKGILFHAPHNLEDTKFTRVRNWREVRSFFEKEL